MPAQPVRVLVLGGRGYFGRRVAQVLTLCEGVDVVIGSRRGNPATDIRDPGSFPRFTEFSIVVNCTDSIGAPPLAAARYVLKSGGVWMDMTADPATVQQLLALSEPEAKGYVIVGVGIFPGLLTMLGAFVAGLVASCDRVDLAVRLSALSGAGPGNCRLMVELLEQPGFDFADGRQRPRPTIGERTTLPFVDFGDATGAAVTLPDTALVRRVTKAPAVASHMALAPAWMVSAFSWSHWILEHAGPLRRLVRALTHASLLLMRGVVLRWVKTRVQLTAIANAGAADQTIRGLSFPDGRDGNALGVAAVVLLWRDVEAPEPGCYAAAALFGLDEALVKLANEGLAPPQLQDPTGAPRAPGAL